MKVGSVKIVEQKPIIMPGPRFSPNPKEKNWWRDNSQKIVIGIIVALIVLGGLSFYKSYHNRKAALAPVLENITQTSPSPTEQISTSLSIADADAETKKTLTQIPEVRKEEQKIVAQAAKGNGKTHLARQAFKEYLKDQPDLQPKITAEHKIYIEDYLRKHVSGPKTLKIGDEISFDNQLIQDAIEKSQQLTDQQLKNLHKYVLLVPSLN